MRSSTMSAHPAANAKAPTPATQGTTKTPAELMQDARRHAGEVRDGTDLLFQTLTAPEGSRPVMANKVHALLIRAYTAARKTSEDLGHLKGQLQVLHKQNFKGFGEQRSGALAEEEVERRALVQSQGSLALQAFDEAMCHSASHPELIVQEPARKRARTMEERQHAAAELVAVTKQAASTSGLQVFVTAGGRSGWNAPKVEAHTAVDVRILCDDVFCAVILLAAPGTPEPQRIAVYTIEERVSPTKDGWGHSNSIVFRRVTSLAMRALDYFRHRAACERLGEGSSQRRAGHPGARALDDLLLWLSTYRDLFTKRCSVTGTLLAAEPSSRMLLPPLLRTYKVSRQKLRAQAKQEEPWSAYHVYAAPINLF